jgi:adenylate cyclase
VSTASGDPSGAPSRHRPQWLRWLTLMRARPLGFVLILAVLLASIGMDTRPQQVDRNELFDLYQRLFPRQRVNDGVVVVAIDDASLKTMGQWPWPRSVLAQIVERVAAEKPAAIAIDAFFPEPDRLSPRQQARQLLRAGYGGAGDSPDRLPDYDEQFAAAIHAAPVVLGVGALTEDAGLPPGTPYRAPILQQGADPARFVPHFPAALRSIEVIDAAAVGHGLMPPASDDGVLRRIPTLAFAGGALLPTLPVETLRLTYGEPALRVAADTGGIRELRLGNRRIRTDRDGGWWLHFSDPQQRPHLSVADLLGGKAPPGLLSGRIALLGYTALGLQDTVVTPRGRMAGAEALAEAMDNVIDNRLLLRPRWSHWLEAALLLGLSLLALLLVPWLRPARAGAILLLALLASLAAGALAFRQFGLLIDVANPCLGAALVFMLILVITLADSQAQRGQLREELEDSRVRQARLEGELDVARRIQMGMLPEPGQVLAAETRVEVAARMLPARSVGGDLYDFFLLDETHLFIMVGDVSGKGLPASLFMALSKALTKGAALRSAADPGRTLRDADAAIAEENPELLFVTVLAGVLDLDRGRLAWSSAGHEPPWLLPAAGGAPRRLETPGGPPLCVVDGYDYRSEEIQLARGDALCLLTDGVGEAQNGRGVFYGSERVAQCLAGIDRGDPAQRIVDALLTDTLAFTGGAEPADDLTILALRWHGAAAGATHTAEAKTGRM